MLNRMAMYCVVILHIFYPFKLYIQKLERTCTHTFSVISQNAVLPWPPFQKLYNDHLNDFTRHSFHLGEKTASNEYFRFRKKRRNCFRQPKSKLAETFTLIRQSFLTNEREEDTTHFQRIKFYIHNWCIKWLDVFFSWLRHEIQKLVFPFFISAFFIITEINTLLTFDEENKMRLSLFLLLSKRNDVQIYCILSHAHTRKIA